PAPGTNVSYGPHGALLQVAHVPRQGLVEQVRGVLAGLARHGPVEVVLQRSAEIGVGAVVDDFLRATSRRQAAQVGHALLGDDGVYVVLGVIHVADHWHQTGNGPVVRGRGREEHRDVGIAREVAGTADTVLNARAHHVC